LAQIYAAIDFATAPRTILNSVEVLARRAVALDSGDAEAYAYLSHALRLRGDLTGALAEAERALALSPNLAAGHISLGMALVCSGRPKEGLAFLETSFRLDPRHRSAGRANWVALGLYFSREYDAAIEAAERAIRSYPDFPNTYRWLAASLGQSGRSDEAKEALKKAIAVAPASFDMFGRDRVPWFRPEDHAHMLEGLRKAGWEG
jgi:adenylate cyclase